MKLLARAGDFGGGSRAKPTRADIDHGCGLGALKIAERILGDDEEVEPSQDRLDDERADGERRRDDEPGLQFNSEPLCSTYSIADRGRSGRHRRAASARSRPSRDRNRRPFKPAFFIASAKRSARRSAGGASCAAIRRNRPGRDADEARRRRFIAAEPLLETAVERDAGGAHHGGAQGSGRRSNSRDEE